MIKKGFIITFILVLTVYLGYGSVTAIESTPITNEADSIATYIDESDWAILEEFSEENSPFVAFSISHSALGINKFIKSKNAFNMKKGDKVKIQSLTWSPTAQKVQLGFVNASNGDQYWTSNYSGGSKVGGTFSLGGPSGSYYIAIRTPSTNSKTINVKGQFEF